MSRQSKNARKIALAKQITAMHQNGEKMGKTTSAHGKRWTYRGNPEIQKRIQEMSKSFDSGKTSMRKVLEGAGAAAAT